MTILSRKILTGCAWRVRHRQFPSAYDTGIDPARAWRILCLVPNSPTGNIVPEARMSPAIAGRMNEHNKEWLKARSSMLVTAVLGNLPVVLLAQLPRSRFRELPDSREI